MYILGINAYHGDSSACLLHDGNLLAAVEEERFTRIKHWAGFPARSISSCLETAGISLDEVDYIAINSDSKANLFRKIVYTLKKKPDPRFILDRIRNRKQRGDIAGELRQAFPDSNFSGEVIPVEHHLAHLASAHTVSPFAESVCVSIDGFGDFSSAAWGIGRGTDIDIAGRVYFPHSLGIFYQAITQFIGFPNYGDEYKVMGLAPYGKPIFLEHMRQLIQTHNDGTFTLNLDYFRHHWQGVDYRWTGGTPTVGQLFSEKMEHLFAVLPRTKEQPLEEYHLDLAHSAQMMYEEVFLKLLRAAWMHFAEQSGRAVDTLTLAGGCAMNSVANGKVYRFTPFQQMYLPPSAGDAGGAVGAALAVWNRVYPHAEQKVMRHAYWGPEFKAAEIEQLLRSKSIELDEAGCEIECISSEAALCERTAEAIAAGKVIGWFQGRMEWGPRALGNRSIVCDPRRADMKEILNSKIKRRESFRPFAPSILREAVADWFEEEDDVPFMMQIFQIREKKRTEIPAVTHVDGSGRLQTVHKETNPRYHRLIACFAELTRVPILLNTSFNENEPIVCTPKEAMACFLRTKMDVLVLGDFFIERLS